MKFYSLLSLIVLFSISSCQNHKSQGGTKKHQKTILISANAIIELEPDMASFRVSLNSEKKKMADSRQALADKQKLLLDILNEFEIDEKDIQTGHISFRKNYSWIRNTQVFKGYISSLSTNICLRDISKLEDLYARIFEEEQMDPSGIQFSHSKMDSIGDIAYQKALENANSTVAKILEKMEESEFEILRVGNNGLGQILDSSMDYTERKLEALYENNARSNANNIQISNGSISISKNLSVEYKIK